MNKFSKFREMTTVYDEGAWHFKNGRRDNIGDYTTGTALFGDRLYYMLMARMGTPPPGGAMWYKPYDGNPYEGWTQGAPPGSRPSPTKSLPGPTGSINIDTHCWVQNPITQVITWVHAVRSGNGKYHLERATSSIPDPTPSAYTRYSEDLLTDSDGECSVVIDPFIPATGVLFYVKKTNEAPDEFGVVYRSRVYRRTWSLIDFDTNPKLGPEEMVFAPDQDGQGEWGTANTVLQPGICILPDRSYLMAALGKKPIKHKDGSPAVGKMNNTVTVGLWRSKDRGKTWKPLDNNPIFSREELGISEGFGNPLNSPHPWYDPWAQKLYVSLKRHPAGNANKVGSRLILCEVKL